MSSKSKTSLRKKNMRLYQIWAHMKYRCDTPTNWAYEFYGGKGITYFNEWKDYEKFYNWAMSTGYNDNLTLDRINSDKNYEPDNCRWITQEFQNKNRNNCFLIEIGNESKTALEWCEIYNLNYNTFFTRYNTYGWDAVEAVTTPVKIRRKPAGFNTKINENKSEIS